MQLSYPGAVRGLAATLLAAALAGCAAPPFAQTTVTTRSPGDPGGAGQGEARAYTCEDGTRFQVIATPEAAHVRLGNRTHRLARRAADRGTRYAAGGRELRIVADHATLVTRDGVGRTCRDAGAAGPWADAALRGVEVRALGHEPGWSLEIVPGRWLHFIPGPGGGEPMLALDPVLSVGTDGTRRYSARARGRELRVRIRAAPCTDSMSGERFALSVTVTLDGRSLQGCGRRLNAAEPGATEGAPEASPTRG